MQGGGGALSYPPALVGLGVLEVARGEGDLQSAGAVSKGEGQGVDRIQRGGGFRHGVAERVVLRAPVRAG